MSSGPNAARRLLVVGGSGHLGRQVIATAAQRGFAVRALLRPGSALPAGLPPVEVVVGDLLDRGSLVSACHGVDAVVTTAIGYSRRRPADGDAPTDRDGQYHLIDTAATAGVRRFIFTSVLTCDAAPEVPHFHDKWLVEQRLERSGLDWCALRPGAFVDQAKDFWIEGLRRGRLDALGNPDVRWSHVHTADLANYLVTAIDLPPEAPRQIDIGCDRPVSPREIAALMATRLGRPIAVRTLPWTLASPLLRLLSLRDPWQDDLRRMFAYILRGTYVADLAAQRRWFGEPPPIEAALARYLEAAGLAPAAGLKEPSHG